MALAIHSQILHPNTTSTPSIVDRKTAIKEDKEEDDDEHKKKNLSMTQFTRLEHQSLAKVTTDQSPNKQKS